MVGDRICTPQIAATIEIAANFFQLNRALHLSFAFVFTFAIRTHKSDLLSYFRAIEQSKYAHNGTREMVLHQPILWTEATQRDALTRAILFYCCLKIQRHLSIREKLRLEINK